MVVLFQVKIDKDICRTRQIAQMYNTCTEFKNTTCFWIYGMSWGLQHHKEGKQRCISRHSLILMEEMGQEKLTSREPLRKKTSRRGKAAHSLRIVSAYLLGTLEASSTTCDGKGASGLYACIWCHSGATNQNQAARLREGWAFDERGSCHLKLIGARSCRNSGDIDGFHTCLGVIEIHLQVSLNWCLHTTPPILLLSKAFSSRFDKVTLKF